MARRGSTSRFSLHDGWTRGAAIAAALAGAIASAACEKEAPRAAGCGSDDDCKGDRICKDGPCVEPGRRRPEKQASAAPTLSAEKKAAPPPPPPPPAPVAPPPPAPTVAVTPQVQVPSQAKFLVKSPAGDVVGDVPAFFLDQFEVTTEQYSACVADGKCTAAGRSPDCNFGVNGREKHPINCVDWRQAGTYCQGRGLRLPTLAEWQLAAYGTDKRPYPWGREPPSASVANLADLALRKKGSFNGIDTARFPLASETDDGFATTSPVGAFAGGRSAFGVADMGGNLKEWVGSVREDPFHPAGSPPSSVQPAGSSFASAGLGLLRTDYSLRSLEAKDVEIGFRCAKDGG